MKRAREPRDVSASVRARLGNLAREQGEDFNLILTRYGIERFLYRMSRTQHRQSLILKGALLFLMWSDQPHRPTRDLDLHGAGEDTIARFIQIFSEICAVTVEDDGLLFDASTIEVDEIREGQEYEGLRIKLTCRLGKARIPIQVDVGFGDVITGGPVEIEYPTLLEFPPPRLHAYSRETVIAEKFQAMVRFGIANTRMKDFYDLHALCQGFDFQGPVLTKAIRSTFERRGTPLPTEVPVALSEEFARDTFKRSQWSAFLRKGRLDAQPLDEVISRLRAFLIPPAQAIKSGRELTQVWKGGGGWIDVIDET